MENLNNSFILEKVKQDDFNYYPKSEAEVLKYLLEFSVEFAESGYRLPKRIL